VVQYLFQEGGANIFEVDSVGQTLWDILQHVDADPVALASLLIKDMVMLDDAPPTFLARLSLAHAELTVLDRHFCAQLRSYIIWSTSQQTSVFQNCPLPPVLLPIVAVYAVTTPDDMWQYGLRVEATASDGGI
jgi:hypothetical protein